MGHFNSGTAKRFVGYIDIMGFKDMVARNSHDSIYLMMTSISEALNLSQTAFGIDRSSDDEEVIIKMMTYSDSIMIYSKDNSSSSLKSFITAIASVTEDLFLAGIPHKGAVAFGLMTLDFENSIFFGQPLIDAYLLQDELNFYGIVAHGSIEGNDNFKDDSYVVEYICPFKNGNGKHYTIFPLPFAAGVGAEEVLDSTNNLRLITSGALRKYIDNTVTYFKYIQEIT